MRNPNVRYLAAIVAVALAACGPSSKELAGVKTARYKGDKMTIFGAAKTATEAKYKLAKVDENTLGITTIGRWYNPEGQLVSERQDDIRDVPQKSINETLVVTLLPDGDAYVIKVKPVMVRYVGTPQLEPLTEDDISVPGWAHGKVDQLQIDIHDALAQYEVKTLPAQPGATGPAAPASNAPGAAPAEPAPAAPAAPPAQ